LYECPFDNPQTNFFMLIRGPRWIPVHNKGPFMKM
jgi:hypothetical protein